MIEKPLIDETFGAVVVDESVADKSVKAVTMPFVPSNAFLVRADKPTWIQVCKGKVAITNGFLWCDEDIGEFHGKEMVVEKTDDGWEVFLPRTTLEFDWFTVHLNGTYIIKDGCMFAAGLSPEPGCVYKDEDLMVIIDEKGITEVKHGIRLKPLNPRKVFKMEKIWFREKVLYGPEQYVEWMKNHLWPKPHFTRL